MIGRRNFQVAVGRHLKRPLHIRLARAEPHFADQNVVDFDAVLAFHHQLERLADLQRV